MTVVFRRSMTNDAPEVHRILHEFATHQVPGASVHAPAIEEVEKVIELSHLDAVIHQVAIQKDAVVGVSIVTPLRHDGSRHVGVHTFVMNSHEDNRDVEKQFLQAVCVACAESGIWRLETTVAMENTERLRLLIEMGFNEEGVVIGEQSWNGQDTDVAHLALLLDSQPSEGIRRQSVIPQNRKDFGQESSIEILPVVASDAREMYQLLESVASEIRWLLMTASPDLDELIRFIRSNIELRNPHLLARHEGRLVGWADIVRIKEDGKRHIGVLGMGVLSDYRGGGIGARLLESLLAWATKEGFKRVQLEVWASNTPAQALYLGRGFTQKVFRRRVRILDGYEDDLITMEMRLDS